MEEGKLFERYGYFSKQMNLLKNMTLYTNPTLDELELTKSMVQTAYRDMKEVNFEGTVVDYICLIASEFFVREWKMAEGRALETLSKKCYESEASKSMLRLFLKNPKYLFNSRYYFADRKIEPDVFKIVSYLRYDYYLKEIQQVKT